ncbi:MAG: hypothetical protein MSC31_18900 [Solirubrobacteraceae bacterium MAG38_C4-C5]|nr:hypothetical protein [Candidatus Siliceabacter maunaloa]
MALGFSDDGLTDENPARQGALQRMREAGTTWGRIIVKWEKWEQESDYRQKILDSARDYRACGFRVLATLTGGQTDDNYTNSPNRDAFADFVEDAVLALDPFGVRDFSLWNEPNLAEWLKAPCSDGRTLASTAARYRVLYDAGYDAARSAERPNGGRVPGLRLYLGELSELPASGRLPGLNSQGQRFSGQRVRTECGSGGETIEPSLKTTEFLAAVVRARPEPLRTSGVAWHPYQHRSAPEKRTYPKPRNAGPTTGGVIGIAYVDDVQNRIKRLFQERSGNDQGPALSTAASRVPALYMTEFGYFSQPFPIRGFRGQAELNTDLPSLSRWQAWHAESTRAEWLPRAYAHAEENGARLMLHWQLDEAGRLITDPVDARFAFDTGLLSVGDVAPDQALSPDAFKAHDIRSYGKDPSVGNSQAERRWSNGTEFQPSRTAFCALRAWAESNDYKPVTITPAEHSADPAVVNPVQCP